MDARIIFLLGMTATLRSLLISAKPLQQIPVQIAKESELMDYLVKYGYLAYPDHKIGRAISMRELKIAIKKMQRFAGLPETGLITDPKALAMVKRTRCGVSDFGPSDLARRKRRYAIQGTKWRKQEVTYRIENYTPDIKNKEDVDRTFEKALKLWSSASGLIFKREDNVNLEPDIRVKFVTGFHGDSRPADGPGGELAHAFFPGADNAGIDGDIHLDDDETFTINVQDGVDLLWVMVHELGHSLGLDHTYHPESVMFAYYMGHVPNLKLDNDDIEGIQKLYGLPDVERVTPSPDPTPKTCSDVKPDAVVTTKDKRTYVFSGKHFWEIKDFGGSDGPFLIKDYWRGLQDNVDASYTQSPHGHTIFLKGDRFWVYVNKEPLYGPGHISEINLPDELANVDGALEWNRNGKVYLFKGSNYWRYDKTRQKIEDGYPRHISAWRGIPSNINAVFQWKNGRSYFFKGTKYYAFDDYSVKVLESPNPYPRDVAAYWMGCTNPEIKLQPRLSASTLGSVPNLFLFPLFFMISQLL
ncbi:PREDICTED: matrix metalloproteinase-24-like [Acropora digitifera]|uniref:matrix metalloproteinase-24-like n=1 Tax=Acropora digitifera TaxID=70779 RepID=UPI00077A3799|nr:PREDICTED: matrix metalloproteinase-24-like [Acropora digitifera]